ncbi:MAG: hypothetical protein GY854_16720 [Deltaproteobacteria bacterium]|nr:hypothetical protein [Deltaproteobacteria bacterium]
MKKVGPRPRIRRCYVYAGLTLALLGRLEEAAATHERGTRRSRQVREEVGSRSGLGMIKFVAVFFELFTS